MKTFNSFGDLAEANGTHLVRTFVATNNSSAHGSTLNYDEDDDDDERYEDEYYGEDDDDYGSNPQFAGRDFAYAHDWADTGPLFNKWLEMHMPSSGFGDTAASHLMTGANKLIYRFYNDGDGVLDSLEDWGNAIEKAAPELSSTVTKLFCAQDPNVYEKLLVKLAQEI